MKLGTVTSSLTAAQANALLNLRPEAVSSSPTNGQNIILTADARNKIVRLTPAGSLASLTITLPPASSTEIGQEFILSSSQTITSLTIVYAGGTQENVPGTLLAQTTIKLLIVSAGVVSLLAS